MKKILARNINAKILFLGVTYKAKIDDLRDSITINLMKRLMKDKIKSIQLSDPTTKKGL